MRHNGMILEGAQPRSRGANISWLERLARRAVCRNLGRIRGARLTLAEGKARVVFGEDGSGARLQATITVNDGGFFTSLALRGIIGGSDAYMRGAWSCDDLTSLVRILVANRGVLEALDGAAARLAQPFLKILHVLRRNDRGGSVRNIAAHYDLGNKFFQLFLDPTMTYSCGIFERADSTLEEASLAKLDRVCAKLGLEAGDHLLEIGTGWGSMAIHAVRRSGCRVTTTTLSEEQYAMAGRRVREAGLEGKITLLRKDYRDLEGSYDKLVSIEMVEAVGEKYLGRFFRACSDRLKPGGRMLLQAIVIPDERHLEYRHSVDFIQSRIFPGSFLPSLGAIRAHVERDTDLSIAGIEDITAHYPPTLRHWRKRFFENLDRVRALGYTEEFIRMWEVYLCYCEGGFLERSIEDAQILLSKPSER